MLCHGKSCDENLVRASPWVLACYKYQARVLTTTVLLLLHYCGSDLVKYPRRDTMGPIALICSIFLYLIASWDFYKKDNFPLCWVFICYALSNIGFLVAAYKGNSAGP